MPLGREKLRETDLKEFLREHCSAPPLGTTECRTLGCFLWAGWDPKDGHEKLQEFEAICPARELARRLIL